MMYIRTVVILLSLLTSCVTQRYFGKTAPVVLGNGDECVSVSSTGRYYLLFGAVPISSIEGPALTAEEGRSFRITERSTFKDFAVTILGGWALTLTRRTVEVESCRQDVLLTSRGAIEKEFALQMEARQKEIELETEKAVAQFSNNGHPIILLLSGESIQGNILEMNSDTIRVAQEHTVEEEKEARVDRVFLRRGSTLEGKVTNQTLQNVTLRTREGTKLIRKADILRVQFQVEPTPRIELSERTIPKSEILKIVLTEKPPEITAE